MRKDALGLAAKLYLTRAQELCNQQAEALIREQKTMAVEFYPPTQAQLEMIETSLVAVEREAKKSVIHEALEVLNHHVDELGATNNFKPTKEQRAAQKVLAGITETLRALIPQ